ncbi:brachyurin-like [Schistocerca gregaria]|uniref:brachyurin-like n=1 Tax=Schistocerca gregaria TaxID=7010 RepID=UPI00211E2E61|nr:brachyurin-like [Schistocerca gregaria]
MGAHILCALLSVLLVVMAKERNTTEDSGAVCQYLMLPESNNADPLPELPTPHPDAEEMWAWQLDVTKAEPEVVEEYRPTIAYEGGIVPMRASGHRIVDGRPAMAGLFPHQALVLGDGVNVCGGSLIRRTAVLTAASCTVPYSKFTIRLGTIHRTEESGSVWEVESVWAIAHPEYNKKSCLYLDVAIVFLPEPAPQSKFINVVALPSSRDVSKTFVGSTAHISGWGRTADASACSEVLQWAPVTVIPNSICEQFYKRGFIVDSMLCAGNKYSGACSGDSGSALVVKTKKGYKQIGVASFVSVKGCEETGQPAGYTRVTSVLDWIKKTAGFQ